MLRDALRFAAGSIATYLVLAACNATAPRTTQIDGGITRDAAAPKDSSIPGDATAQIDDSGAIEDLTEAVAEMASEVFDLMGPHDTAIPVDLVANANADESGARLKVRYYAGADGSKLGQGLWDSQLQVPCVYSPAGDGMTRCVPIEVVAYTIAVLFADANCTQPAAYFQQGCKPQYVASTGGASCAGLTTRRIYEVGPKAVDVYVMSNGNCVKGQGGGGTDYYTAGAEVPPATFVAGTLTHQ